MGVFQFRRILGTPGIKTPSSIDLVTIELVFTPKALHSKAQGRRASGAPWVYNAAWIQTPTGFYKCVMPAYRSFVQHEHRHARRAIVQPRWGNHIAVHRVTRGTRRCREPRAMECNAFGVGAIGHIVRLRNDGPLGTPVGRIGYAVRMHRVQRLDPRSIRMHQRITSTTNWFLRRRRYIPKPRVAAPAAHPGFTCRAESKPQRGFTNA